MEGIKLEMIFLLSGELLASNQVRSTDLLALFRGSALRRHALLVVDDPLGSSSTESRELDRWMAKLTPTLEREMRWLRECLSRIPPTAVTRGATTIAVVDAVPANLRTDRVVLELMEAVRLATLPLFILVENALSDGAFLRRTLPVAWRRKLLEWERAGVVMFEHGGGLGEMKRLVERCSARGNADPLGLGASAWRASHVLVSDRDSTDLNGKASDEVRQLQRACGQAMMEKRLHILRRRDQEAYLPREALMAIAESKTGTDREKMVEKLKRHLAADSRHHSQLPRIVQSSSWFKGAFLAFEESLAWDDAWFERDGSGPEMVDLAEMIASFL